MHHPRSAISWLHSIPVTILIGFCTLQATPVFATPASTLSLTPCHITNLEDRATCGTLEVPLDRDDPNSKMIDLSVIILPPSGGAIDKTPLFLLAGGPGQAARDQGQVISFFFKGIREGRELVLIDQRGTGGSAPLTCNLDGLSVTTTGKEMADLCKSSLEYAPQHFTTAAFIADLETARQALGYDKISLWGGSYGTRAALLYAKEYSINLETMVLDSVAPPTIRLFEEDAATFSASLEKTLQACAADAECAAAFPDLKRSLQDLLSQLTKTPREVQFETTALSVTGDIFANGLRGALYSPELSAILPFVISEATKGNFLPWKAFAETDITEGGISTALFLSVQCAEETPRTGTPKDSQYMSSMFDFTLREACENWAAAPYPANFEAPVTSNIPTLLLSGYLDPITPPRYAEEAAATLSHSKHLIAPAAAHIVSTTGCAPRLIEEFLNSKDASGIDGSCLEEVGRPPFTLSAIGPKP